MNQKENNSAVIIQARMSSIRFPGKMMSHISGMPLVEYAYKRCRKSSVKNILIATSEDKSDDVLYDHCKKNNIRIIRGSLDNVLQRYIQAAEFVGTEYIIRVSGDTPFVDVSLIDMLVKLLVDEKLEYVSLNRPSCASGFYSEAVTLQALKRVAGLTQDKEDLQHVTKFIIDSRDKFLTRFLDVDLNPAFVKKVRLTVDYPEDIQRANTIVNQLTNGFSFTSKEILNIVGEKEFCK